MFDQAVQSLASIDQALADQGDCTSLDRTLSEIERVQTGLSGLRAKADVSEREIDLAMDAFGVVAATLDSGVRHGLRLAYHEGGHATLSRLALAFRESDAPGGDCLGWGRQAAEYIDRLLTLRGARG